MKKKEFRVRCWIDIDGVKFFGPGRSELLTLIQETGSISKAAKVMGMSYKKAWAMVEEMNSQGSHPFVITHKRGKKSGGTELTAAGNKIVDGYNKLTAKLSSVVRKEKELLYLHDIYSLSPLAFGIKIFSPEISDSDSCHCIRSNKLFILSPVTADYQWCNINY